MDINVDQFKDAKFWRQALNEFMGTMFWALFFSQTGLDNSFALGITYVVVRTCLGEDCHLFTPWTLYKMVERKHLDPLKGLVWIGLQFAGCWVAGQLAGALGLKSAHEFEGQDSFTAWSDNLRFFIALMFLMHGFVMYHGERDLSMQKQFYLIFVFACVGWFMGQNTEFNFAFQFFSVELANVWVNFVWTLLAVIFSWVKFEYILE